MMTNQPLVSPMRDELEVNEEESIENINLDDIFDDAAYSRIGEAGGWLLIIGNMDANLFTLIRNCT